MTEYHPLRTTDQNPTTVAYAQLNIDAEQRAKQCPTAEMPDISHLKSVDYQNVYEPSDDTFLLIDAIGFDIDLMEKEEKEEEEEPAKKKRRLSDIKTTLEIGCGTGVPGIYLTMRLRAITGGSSNNSSSSSSSSSNAILHYMTDINSDAIRIAKSTAEMNGTPANSIQAIQCDLASDVLLERYQNNNNIDILIFNPPYVPTPNEEVGSTNGIEASWAGGTNGRIVLDKALPQIAQLLAYPHGVAYIVVVDDNYPEQLGQFMDETYGMKVVPWLRRRARNEFLTILKMTPTRAFK